MKMRKSFIAAVCAALFFSLVPVWGATLEDSMLKPPSEESGERSVFSPYGNGMTTAADLVDLAQAEKIEKIGELCHEDYERSGILASVSAAQCILESGYLSTELATEANNCFGMKAELSGNNWEGSTWDGESVYRKETGEEYGGKQVTIVADFRSYDCIEASVADHSAYLLGAEMDGHKLRYEGLAGETDYRRAIQIIKDGGYATDSAYVSKVCKIIEKYDLTRFDEIEKQEQKKEQSDKGNQKTKNNKE